MLLDNVVFTRGAAAHLPDKPVTVAEKFLMEKPNNILPDPGIEPRTCCSSVALATTRPTRQ